MSSQQAIAGLSQEKIRAFADDMRALKRKWKKITSDTAFQEKELRHYDWVSIGFNLAMVAGSLTLPLYPNIITALLLSLGIFGRWTCIAHAVLHGGYDHTDRPKLKRGRFAHGLDRFVSWLEWWPAESWIHEHNKLHHYALGEAERDPDCVAYTTKGISLSSKEVPFLVSSWSKVI